MMKLSTLLKVGNTVDMQWRSRIAERILSYWEHDSESAQFFRSSTNFVYVFRKAGERSFLRFAAVNPNVKMLALAQLASRRSQWLWATAMQGVHQPCFG